MTANRANRFSALLTSDSFYPPKGGGDLSLRMLAGGLSERGYEITVSYFGDAEDPVFKSRVFDDSSPVRGFWPRHMIVRNALKSKLREVIAECKPDIVITQQIALSPTVDICRESGVPVIVLLRGVDFLCLGSYWSGRERFCDYRCVGCVDVDHRLTQFPFFRREIFKIHASLRHASAVISNSEYTKRVFKNIMNIDSTVLNPPIESTPTTRAVRERGNILFVSPVRHKGVDLAIELARRLDKEEFLFIGGTKRAVLRRISELDNVRYIPWLENMSSSYLGARLVIVPSVIPEGYGRVVAEAMLHGTPCAVSSVGALPEVVSDAGDVVSNHGDVNEWVRVINKYSNPKYVRMKSELALGRASHLMTRTQYTASVESIVRSLLANR